MTRRTVTRSIAIALIALAAGGACSNAKEQTKVDGQVIVPIDPARPGDSLFKEGLDLYNAAEVHQSASIAAKVAGNAPLAASEAALALADYGSAQAKFDQLRGDPTLCPSPSIRCDNAAYLAGRSSYESGTLPSPNDQAALEDARSRLDAMLADFPTSSFADSAAYFDGRAHYELTSGFGVGSFADAELLFERSLAANPSGTWADNALYYDGRCEFELALPLLPLAVSPAPEYSQARAWLDQGIAAFSSLKSRFPTSTYLDNAGYYLGRSWFEKPTLGTLPDAERVANLNSAITALGPVVSVATSYYNPGARYWRGRAHYTLSFHRDLQPDKDAESTLALADFHAVAATSPWRDNGLYYAVKSQIRKADLAAACGEYSAMAIEFPLVAGNYTDRASVALTDWLTLTAQVCP